MFRKPFLSTLLLLSLLAALLTACAPQEPTIVEVTRVVEQTVVVTQIQEVVITATPLPPTPTPLVTPTDALALPTISPLTPAADAASFWCIPEESAISLDGAVANLPAVPEGAVSVNFADPKQIIAYPFNGCIFSYNFNQPVPAGAFLEIYDQSSKPWFVRPLTAAPSNPNVGYVIVKHSSINNPQVWNVVFPMKVKLEAGDVVWTGSANVDAGWRAPLCWTGYLPNPITLRCPAWQDTHPDDPGYTPWAGD